MRALGCTFIIPLKYWYAQNSTIMIAKSNLSTIVLTLLILFSFSKSQHLTAQDDLNEGTLYQFIIHSPSLEGNFLGDSPHRGISVYLPPGYYSSPGNRYPVMYWMHSYGLDHTSFFGGGSSQVNLKTSCDALITAGEIDSMIVVSADSYNKYGSSIYTNSSTTGNWEDFIAKDVINYIDLNFRTLPQKESRGIAGHSTGGQGTLWISMNNPGNFNAAYVNCGWVDFTEKAKEFKDEMIAAGQAEEWEDLNWLIQAQIAEAAAFAPDTTSPPFYCQFPYDDSEELIDSIWGKYLEHDLFTQLPEYKDSLLQLSALQLDWGDKDFSSLRAGNQNFTERLTELSIEHVAEEFDGGHSDKQVERIETRILPFFSEHLSDAMISDTIIINLIEWQEITIDENHILNEAINVDASSWDSEKISYEIAAGDPEGLFSIDNANNKIMADTLNLDYETKSYHDLLLKASYQNGEEVLQDYANVFIWINNINDSPPVANDTTFILKDNSPNNTTVGRLMATDPEDNKLDFEIIDGNLNEAFSINSYGTIKLKNNETIDFSTMPQYVLEIVVFEKDGPFSDTANVTIDIVVSILDKIPDNKISIFPNPADDILHITFASEPNAIVEVYNVLGKRMIWKAISSEYIEIDISTMPSGFYFIKVEQNEEIHLKKLVVR